MVSRIAALEEAADMGSAEESPNIMTLTLSLAIDGICRVNFTRP